MFRLISWHIDRNGNKVAGIEDTGKGWAVVDSNEKQLLFIDGYSCETRDRIERYYEECIQKLKKIQRVCYPPINKD